MASNSKKGKGYVKTENMLLTIAAALAVGFFMGVVFSVYKFGPRMEQSINAQAQQPEMSAEIKQTLAELIQKTKNNPMDVEAWSQLGHLYFDTGQFRKAIKTYKKSLALDDQRPDLWTDLGVMHRRNKDSKNALKAFDRALQINAKHEFALFNKGVVLMHDLQDAEGALKAWEKLIQINPDFQTPGGQSVKAIVQEMKKTSMSESGSEPG